MHLFTGEGNAFIYREKAIHLFTGEGNAFIYGERIESVKMTMKEAQTTKTYQQYNSLHDWRERTERMA